MFMDGALDDARTLNDDIATSIRESLSEGFSTADVTRLSRRRV